MAIGTGISGQVGFAAESTYGTAVTVTKFVEVDKWSIKKVPNWMRSNGIRSGQLMDRSEDSAIGTFDVSGSMEMDLTAKNVALLFKHAVGAVVTSGAGPFTHTITPATTTGLSLTMQGGIPDVGGTVRPFTASGVKVTGFEVSWARDKWLTAAWDLLAKDSVTATALATASYSSANPPYGWPHVVVTIGGAEFKSLSGKVSFKQAAGPRFYAGATTTAEPLQNGKIMATLELTGHFESLTAYDRTLAGTEAAVSVAITNGVNSVTFSGNARFMDGAPELSGIDYIDQPYKAEFAATGADSTGFTVVVVSPEATP
ncbi:MAG: phage tail tube protein [Actinomycetota bacterium]|nr:phage tail tube protein [Actinomycetota bacterium]